MVISEIQGLRHRTMGKLPCYRSEGWTPDDDEQNRNQSNDHKMSNKGMLGRSRGGCRYSPNVFLCSSDPSYAASLSN